MPSAPTRAELALELCGPPGACRGSSAPARGRRALASCSARASLPARRSSQLARSRQPAGELELGPEVVQVPAQPVLDPERALTRSSRWSSSSLISQRRARRAGRPAGSRALPRAPRGRPPARRSGRTCRGSRAARRRPGHQLRRRRARRARRARPGSARAARRRGGSPRSPRSAPVERAAPGEQLLESGARRRRRRSPGELAGCALDRRAGVAALVWVRSDHDHLHSSLRLVMLADGADLRSTHLTRGGCHAPIKSGRRSSGGGGRHNRCRSDPLVDSDKGVSPSPAREPTWSVGRHRRRGRTVTVSPSLDNAHCYGRRCEHGIPGPRPTRGAR